MIKFKIQLTLITIFFICLNSTWVYSQIFQDPDKSFSKRQITNQDKEKNFVLANSFETDTLSKFPIYKSDFMVNSLEGDYGSDQFNPDIAMNSSGNYGLTWIDERNGSAEVYAQFYNNFNQRIGSNIKISGVAKYDPVIAAFKSGDYILAWHQEYNSIYVQKFTEDGTPVGFRKLVNIELGSNVSAPSIAINDSGSYMVVWSQNLTGDPNEYLFARLFNADGLSIGNRIVINDSLDNSITNHGWSHRVAADDQGNFIIAWSEYIEGISRVLLQRVNRHNQKIGSNVIASDQTEMINDYFASVSATADGHFLIAWERHFPENYIYGRIYDSNGFFVTDQIEIMGGNNFSYPSASVSTDRDSIFVVLYSGTESMKCRKISKSGHLLDVPVVLRTSNSDSIIGSHTNMSNIIDDKLLIAFEQARHSDVNIFLQKYNKDFSYLGALEKVNDDSSSADQLYPLACFNPRGGFIVAWEDHRFDGYDLFAQVFDRYYQPVGPNIQVNDTLFHNYYPRKIDIAALSDGSFVIAFTAWAAYDRKILLQMVENDGQKINDNVLVMDDYYQYDVRLNVNQQDEILLCWYDYSFSVDYAYLRLFNRDLVPLSGEKRIIDYAKNVDRRPFAMSINNELEILVSWCFFNRELNKFDDRLFEFIFEKTGELDYGTIKYNVCPSSGIPYMANYLNDEEEYVVSWYYNSSIYINRNYPSDKSSVFKNYFYIGSNNANKPQIVMLQNHKSFTTWNSGKLVYGYYFNDNKRSIHPYLLHTFNSDENNWTTYYKINDTRIFEDKLLFTYQSTRNGGTGYDIWANVQLLDQINFDEELFFPPVTDDVLYQNFPNPFNATTNIVYELYAFHHVKISIFDVLGRQIKVLRDQYQEKGLYELNFDASNLPSGIYYCRLEAFRTKIIKMLLIK